MNNQFLGMSSTQFNTLVMVLLLVILGVVSFHYYTYLSASDGIRFGTGASVQILGEQD